MTKIEKPEEYIICEFDGVGAAHVYTGSFRNLVSANKMLVWREDEELGEMCYKPYKLLTLKEVANQIGNLYGGKYKPMITVFIETPLNGIILQYGNHGDEWWNIGEMAGYA